MKTPIRIILALLCAGIIVCVPFFLSAPMMLTEAKDEMYEYYDNEDEDEDEPLDFGRLFFSSALAEEEELIMESIAEDGKLTIPAEWELPFDFSIPPEPDPDRYTETGYEDQSIRVRVETREMFDSVVNVAFVEIASPTQLRTATPYGLKSEKPFKFQSIAAANNAVIAMNGDMFADHPGQKQMEYRMTEVVSAGGKRNNRNQTQDQLFIDKEGNFTILLNAGGMSKTEFKNYLKEHSDEIVNAYTFGPALVKDGEIPDMTRYTLYDPKGRNPRSAIGQTGPLSYVMVVVEGRDHHGSKGVTHAQMAEIMKELGCIQAYNLDGGNTAEMIMIGTEPALPKFYFTGQNGGRGQNDIIYFATAVPVEERK